MATISPQRIDHDPHDPDDPGVDVETLIQREMRQILWEALVAKGCKGPGEGEDAKGSNREAQSAMETISPQ
eukprot:8281162-Karenia_brevis.AAC.1